MKDITEDTDGCGSQFQGQTDAGRVARPASSAISVRRKSTISIPGHGKNHSDHQGYTMDRNLKEPTLSDEAPVLSGTRGTALVLAQRRPEPAQTHEAKNLPCVGAEGRHLRVLRQHPSRARAPAAHDVQGLQFIPR